MLFESALFFDGTTNTLHRVTRRWQLTNTRYLLAPFNWPRPKPWTCSINKLTPASIGSALPPASDVEPKPGIPNPTGLDELTAVITPDGEYAVFDFTGALPRAKLYDRWQVSTNDTRHARRHQQPRL